MKQAFHHQDTKTQSQNKKPRAFVSLCLCGKFLAQRARISLERMSRIPSKTPGRKGKSTTLHHTLKNLAFLAVWREMRLGHKKCPVAKS
jgi:hypothetical protein